MKYKKTRFVYTSDELEQSLGNHQSKQLHKVERGSDILLILIYPNGTRNSFLNLDVKVLIRRSLTKALRKIVRQGLKTWERLAQLDLRPLRWRWRRKRVHSLQLTSQNVISIIIIAYRLHSTLLRSRRSCRNRLSATARALCFNTSGISPLLPSCST